MWNPKLGIFTQLVNGNFGVMTLEPKKKILIVRLWIWEPQFWIFFPIGDYTCKWCIITTTQTYKNHTNYHQSTQRDTKQNKFTTTPKLWPKLPTRIIMTGTKLQVEPCRSIFSLIRPVSLEIFLPFPRFSLISSDFLWHWWRTIVTPLGLTATRHVIVSRASSISGSSRHLACWAPPAN